MSIKVQQNSILHVGIPASNRVSQSRASQSASGYGVLMQCLISTAIIGLGASYGSFYVFHAVLILVLVISLTQTNSRTLFGQIPAASKYHRFFFFMPMWFIVGLIWSLNRLYSLQYIAYVGIGSLLSLSIIYYVQSDFGRFEKLFSVASRWFLIDVLVGLLESLTPFRLPISPFSRYSKHFSSLDLYSSETMEHLEGCPTGFHWNPNNYAVVMILILPFFLLHKKTWVRLIGLGAISWLVIASSSRGCMIAMAFVVCLIPLLSKKSTWLIRGGVLIAVLLLALPGVVQLIESSNSLKIKDTLNVHEVLQDYLFTENVGKVQNSVQVRRHLIHNGILALQASHYLGVGGGADKAVQESAGGMDREITSMHNFWIEVLVCGGIPFFAVFAFWYGRLVLDLYLTSSRLPLTSRRRYYSGALALSLLGFVPGAISASSTIYVLPMYIVFGFSVALINVCRTAKMQQENKILTANRRLV